VRLDHLLSKEQLSVKADSSPRPAYAGSGCSQAETLACSNRQRPAFSEYSCFGGVENGLVRLGTAKNKHPVGYLKEQP
jgi:hypothetical protein